MHRAGAPCRRSRLPAWSSHDAVADDHLLGCDRVGPSPRRERRRGGRRQDRREEHQGQRGQDLEDQGRRGHGTQARCRGGDRRQAQRRGGVGHQASATGRCRAPSWHPESVQRATAPSNPTRWTSCRGGHVRDLDHPAGDRRFPGLGHRPDRAPHGRGHDGHVLAGRRPSASSRTPSRAWTPRRSSRTRSRSPVSPTEGASGCAATRTRASRFVMSTSRRSGSPRSPL